MIYYKIGDATDPQVPGNKIITHVCNNSGLWGRGFVMALSKKWPLTRECYIKWHAAQFYNNVPFDLGQVQMVQVEGDIWVLNMVAQHHIKCFGNPLPLRYNHLLRCLETVAEQAKSLNASVHMPRIGCGLAGGEWSKVEEIINEALGDIQVYVYDLKDIIGPSS